MHAAAIVTPSDPFFTTDPTAEDKQWYLPKTHVPEAWGYTKGSSTVAVAVIDTGIHAGHIELNDGRVGEGYNAIKKEAIAHNFNADDNGHGTAVAGVLGAIQNNGKGIEGIDWDVRLMGIKAIGAEGRGGTCAGDLGIVWAADHGANIINLSLGGPGFGPDMTLSNAITYAYNKGVLLVAAAGNDLADHGLNLDSNPIYPVCADNGQNMILGVAATDINDQKASFSNFGSLCIDIAAPGKRIVTTAYLPSDPSNNILIYGSGSSLATPIVSGIAALIKASNNNLSNVEIRNLIMKTADNIDFVNQTSCLGGSCNGFLGKGRINALTALAPQPMANGSLVRQSQTGNIYCIVNNTRRQVSDTVFKLRGFDPTVVVDEVNNQLNNLPIDRPLLPLDGTLIKSPDDAQVYLIDSELKRPLTYLVFISRALSFANIKIFPRNEIESYPTGEWAEPLDGTMVLLTGDPTVYVMDKRVVRPVTFYVFKQRNLSFTKVIRVTPDEFSHIPKPTDAYWLSPVDGTLIKSAQDSGIYVIENGTRRLFSYQVFVARNYKFSQAKTLPQAEVDVIAPGFPLLTP